MKEPFENKLTISCFLSASASPDDREIVDWFSDLLKKFEIFPVFATNHPEPRPPPEKIEDLIRKSDMFIAVITRRTKIEKKDSYIGPEWVQNEIAMAHTLKKPIAIFVEEKVQFDQSIVPYITDYVRFNRNDLNSILNKAKAFILAMFNKIKNVKSSLKEASVIDDTIVEETEEGLIERTIIKLVRKVIISKYGTLKVSLKGFYITDLVLIIFPSYFVYDYFIGTKIFGIWGGIIGLIFLIVLISIPFWIERTRCNKCKSYFSERPRPITYGDLKKFQDLPQNRKLLKFECEVCGNTRYDTIERP